MADQKITGLTNFDSSNTPYWPPAPASDVIPIVDISDNTMAASGTTKKISINNLLSSSPTASGALTVTGLVTAGSATITGDLTVDTNVLKVDTTNNRVGIGTASPYSTGESLNARTTALTSTAAFQSMPLTVTDSTAYAAGVGGGINFRAKLDPSSYSNYAAIWSYRESATNSDYRGSLIFGTSDNSNGYPIERLSVTSAGNVNIANGNLVMTTSGKGIDFSAVTGGTGTATGNVLNDYEEGTWTPTIVGTPDAGTATYTQQIGRYTKVGRLVTVDVYVSWSAHTGTGNMRIAGLPFTTASSPYSSVSFGYLSGIALTAGNTMIGFTQLSDTKIELWQTPTGGGTSTVVPVDTAGDIICSVTYTV